ncbi:MAG: phosphoribosylformylglycinamidine synthase [Clostridiales bacterium]|jgi:phosphoribosylformylglycinamidine synthase|nr:phosphoribosylformylglycinamidine synthase [Clostridiales bacterium]
MHNKIHRIFVEKKPAFAVEAQNLLADLNKNLGIKNLDKLRLVKRYDVSGLDDAEISAALFTVFADPTLDLLYQDELPAEPGDFIFGSEYLPGQFDLRANSAAGCLQLITQKELPLVRTAKIYVLSGQISSEEKELIDKYFSNPIDSQKASMDKPLSLETNYSQAPSTEILSGFCALQEAGLQALLEKLGLAMSLPDLAFCQEYFRNKEQRDPTLAEIRVLDTYWSDHCRHTTFFTEIKSVRFDEGHYNLPVKKSYDRYQSSRSFVHKSEKPVCLMDIATLTMKELRQRGLLADLDISEEVNACTLQVEIEVDGKKEPWLFFFKNETHNHPTEIEPFGGAATCLGGGIRDPLSGRSYVYQAMRLTGSGDPRQPISDTLPGKLPQLKITRDAARGYSSYGNQVGLAAGQVAEIYHPGFVAKRMEIGALVAAAPAANVRRGDPLEGDLVILLGGRTGRDGIGGATGSSKEQDEHSLITAGAEVQKGDAPLERKIVRLFRNQAASTLIKRCNDFGAGGVSVAIGELADSLLINLDAVPVKYQGLSGTELALSESQERMAVVVEAQDAPRLIELAKEESLEATVVAQVTGSGRMVMTWRGETIVDISRDFLSTNGVRQQIGLAVAAADEEKNYFHNLPINLDAPLEKIWLENLSRLNHASQKGLAEQFDSTIGAATVLMPFGGKKQLTPSLGMAAKFPVLGGETKAASLMSWGYNPDLAQWSPYHGALYAVTEAIAKIVAMGGSPQQVRLSFQEYFEKLGQDQYKWGKPFAALLGAFEAQINLAAPAVGGKDSMSGTFHGLHVPPTLVAFAVATVSDAAKIISPEFKKPGSHVVLIPLICDAHEVPDFDLLKTAWNRIHQLIGKGLILAAQTIGSEGITGAVSKMAFGNWLGMTFSEDTFENDLLFSPDLGSMILEIDGKVKPEEVPALFKGINFQLLGYTRPDPFIYINEQKISLDSCLKAWQEPLAEVFPTETETEGEALPLCYNKGALIQPPAIKIARPRVIIPVFLGSNNEYDLEQAFTKAGALADILVFCNQTPSDIEESIEALAKAIAAGQILMIPGGFGAGGDSDGSAKMILATLKNPRIKEAISRHLEQQDGLILGISTGFQALLNLGLLTDGSFCDQKAGNCALAPNTLGRHISCLTRTKVVSNLSPWFSACKPGEIYLSAASHSEGRFVSSPKDLARLADAGQIACQYVDETGNPSMQIQDNPSGSMGAVEALTSPDGRVLGKMTHPERMGDHVAINVPGEKTQPIFLSGVNYFK